MSCYSPSTRPMEAPRGPSTVSNIGQIRRRPEATHRRLNAPGATIRPGRRGPPPLPPRLGRLSTLGLEAGDALVHLGPAICGRCYEVGPDVYEQLTGWQTMRHRNVDLRALLAEQAKNAGVRRISASAYCTRCDNDRFFSH